MNAWVKWCSMLLFVIMTGQSAADEIRVAVAANFARPMQKIATMYEIRSGDHVVLIVGGTGKFYTQIEAGAPYDVLLAADSATPARLVAQGLASAESRFTYAKGKLVLWSADPKRVDAQGAVLRQSSWKHLALADPQLAPYGLAARQTLDHMGIHLAASRLVMGEDIGQTWQFVASGNAELGFVAYSQILDKSGQVTGSYWRIPQRFYSPVRQDAVVLVASRGRPSVNRLMAFLRSNPQALQVISSYGYEH